MTDISIKQNDFEVEKIKSWLIFCAFFENGENSYLRILTVI